MSFLLGLSVGSVLGFIVACFCSLAAWQALGPSTGTECSEAIEEVAEPLPVSVR